MARQRSTHVVINLFAILATLIVFPWITIVPIYILCAVDLREDYNFPSAWRTFAMSWLLMNMVIIPVALFFSLRNLRPRIKSATRFGVLAGLAWGLWCSTALLAVPYIGLYPNLPTVWLGYYLSGGANREMDSNYWFVIPTIITNLTLWPLMGWVLAARRRERRARLVQ